MPRAVNTKPCRWCRKSVDTRGIKVHQLTCHDRPAETDETIRHLDGERLTGNIRVMLDYYREGLRDGFQFAGKKAA